MKIFNGDNDNKRVYVQIKDLTMLKYANTNISNDVFEAIYDANDTNQDENDFVMFDKLEDINFFKSMDFIVDYKVFKDLSIEEIQNQKTIITNEMTNIVNKLDLKDKTNNKTLLDKYELLKYKLDSINDIILNKSGIKDIPFPLVVDTDSFIFNGDDRCEYTIRGSLDQNKALIYRKDGRTLRKNDSVLIAANNSSFKDNYEINNYISDDNQFLVIQFISNELERKDEYIANKNEEKGIQKLIKKFLKF